jgi:hypothetical protein
MISVTFILSQAQAQAPAAPAAPQMPDPAQIREQVRAGLEAARAAREAQTADQQHQRIVVGPNGVTIGPATPGQPGVTYLDPRAMNNMIPQRAVDISIAFFIMVAVIIVGFPIARAFGKRIERRGQVATLDAGTMEQLHRIEQAVDAMAIEVERISESQRFMARLQSDAGSQALPGAHSR